MLGVLVVVGAVIAFYLGYGPGDLMALFSGGGSDKSAMPIKARQAAPHSAPQPQNPAPPVQRGGGVTVIANGPDGSLEHRWTNSVPGKP